MATHVHGWRRWLFGGYVLVTAVFVIVWGFFITGPAAQTIDQRQREGLVAVANATGVALQTSNQPPDEILARIAASDNLRLTLIAADGTVLAESIGNDGPMENHADRVEVRDALAGGLGVDQRESETDGVDYLYVAVPCTYQDKIAVVRVSRTMERVNRLMEGYLWMSVGLVGIALIVALVAAWLVSRRAFAPVQRLEQVRTDFVANASHELKTPVAGIRLLSESLAQANETGDTVAMRELLNRLGHESARLQSLACDLMDLSRLEADLRPQSLETTCDLASVTYASYAAHLSQAEARGIGLELQDLLPEGKPCRVVLSATDTTLIVNNLIDNAIAYTDEGSVTLRVSVKDGRAMFVVADNGIGIPPVDQERVFELFYRVDTARSRASGGTGLGLALVRHAVERGGGTIELSSQVGVGSTFVVTLPRVSATA